MAQNYTNIGGTTGTFRLYVNVDEQSTNQSANTSVVRYRCRVYRSAGSSRVWNLTYSGTTSSLSITGETNASNNNFGYDFNIGVGSWLNLIDVTRTVDHATDGTGSASATASVNMDNSPYITTASVATTQTLTNFPEPTSTGLHEDNLTHESVTLDCTGGSNGNGTSRTLTWYYRKGTSGGWTNAGTSSANGQKALTGLDANSTYQWYIKTTNNTGNTSNSSTQSFVTLKAPSQFFLFVRPGAN